MSLLLWGKYITVFVSKWQNSISYKEIKTGLLVTMLVNLTAFEKFFHPIDGSIKKKSYVNVWWHFLVSGRHTHSFVKHYFPKEEKQKTDSWLKSLPVQETFCNRSLHWPIVRVYTLHWPDLGFLIQPTFEKLLLLKLWNHFQKEYLHLSKKAVILFASFCHYLSVQDWISSLGFTQD